MSKQKQSTTNKKEDTIVPISLAEFDEAVETVLANLADDMIDFGVSPSIGVTVGLLCAICFMQIRGSRKRN